MAIPTRSTLRWPFWLRLVFSLSIILGGWIVLFWKLFDLAPGITLQIMGALFGIHFAFIALLIGLRKLRARLGLWRSRRILRRKQEQVAVAVG